jgi:hypothetical protein
MAAVKRRDSIKITSTLRASDLAKHAVRDQELLRQCVFRSWIAGSAVHEARE